jgi:hypothetical protein
VVAAAIGAGIFGGEDIVRMAETGTVRKLEAAEAGLFVVLLGE